MEVYLSMAVEKRNRYAGYLYSMGYLGVALYVQVVVSWITYFYAPPVERGWTVYAPIGLVGIAMVIGRVIDAIADPIVGVWSDNTRSRWGRRVPFILIGTPLLTLTFILMWRPPVSGESTANLIYLSFMLGAFFLFFTVVVAPYLALLPEIARGNNERVTLSAWQALFNTIGLGIAMVGSAILIEKMGFLAMGIILGLVGWLSLWAPLAGVRERLTEGDLKTPGLSFRESFAETIKNRVFLHYVIPQLLFWLGFNMVMMVIPYLVTVVMGLTEGQVGMAQGLALLVSVVMFPVVTRLATIKGNKVALNWTMGLFVVTLSLLGTVGMWPVFPVQVQGLIVMSLAGIPLAGLFILPNALLAEITDYDEQKTGRRREAIYFGVQGLMTKGAIALSSFIVTWVMATFGYSSARPLGILLIGPIAAVFALAGLLIFRSYPLGQPERVTQGHREIP